MVLEWGFCEDTIYHRNVGCLDVVAGEYGCRNAGNECYKERARIDGKGF